MSDDSIKRATKALLRRIKYRRNRETILARIRERRADPVVVGRERERRRKYYHQAGGLQNSALLAKYGITTEQFLILNNQQDGLCAICGGPPGRRKTRLCVDHDHKTGKVRGLLCNDCNNGLGRFKDDTAIVSKALAYLDKHGAK